VTTDGSQPGSLSPAQLLELLQENQLLRAQRDELLDAQKARERTIHELQIRVQDLLRRMYGRSSEKIDPRQMKLFEEMVNRLLPEEPGAQSVESAQSSPGPTPVAPAPGGGTSGGHGRRMLPASLPREIVIHDLSQQEKLCPCCAKERHPFAKETSEQLDYVPAKLTVIQHVRIKYVCKACEAGASLQGPQIETASKPLMPIEKGLAAPGLLATLIVSKYADHLPLHRLEKILQRYDISIARSTMCDWMAQCAQALKPLYDAMAQEVRGSKVIHTDDTPVDVQDKERTSGGGVRIGRFWVYLGDKHHPQTVFDYTPNRSRDGPQAFLAGWSGHLQADAFSAYDGIYMGQAGGKVVEAACWAHARRKFFDARSSDEQVSTQALAYIRLLYDIEDKAKKQELDSEARKQLRQAQAAPLLKNFRGWLETCMAVNGGHVMPKSPMGQAIGYAFNQWEALNVYTTDADLAIDNNASENALRRVALGRKNWLFVGSDNGGETAAILFTMIATCQRHKVNPVEYLRDVLTRIAAHPANQLRQLMPDLWKPRAALNK
jgi:transposase